MKKNEKLFLSIQEPPLDLKEKILTVIKKEKIKRYTQRNLRLIFSSIFLPQLVSHILGQIF